MCRYIDRQIDRYAERARAKERIEGGDVVAAANAAAAAA